MTIPTDFSEIREAARLLSHLMGTKDPAEKTGGGAAGKEAQAAVMTRPAPADSPPGFRGDRIENALELLCKRGGFSGAVIADEYGLPLAVHNSPVGVNALAAFTSVLGSALEKAALLLEQQHADNISMDINYVDKVVLRRFKVRGLQYYLMVICPQHVDERSEIELSLEQIVSILG